jgi:hypothetical protein
MHCIAMHDINMQCKCNSNLPNCLIASTTFSFGRPPFFGHFALQQKRTLWLAVCMPRRGQRTHIVAGSLHECTTCKLLDDLRTGTRSTTFQSCCNSRGKTAEWRTPQTWGVACPKLRPGNACQNVMCMPCNVCMHILWVGLEESCRSSAKVAQYMLHPSQAVVCIAVVKVTGLESHTRCASRAHVVRLYVP